MASNFYNQFIMLKSIIAVIYGAFIICLWVDLKRLTAYASISHMGLITVGIFSYCIERIIGALLMMIAHCLSNFGMFIISNVYHI